MKTHNTRQAFGNAAKTYALGVDVQPKMAAVLDELARPYFTGGTVLELGAGTGLMTQRIMEWPGLVALKALDLSLPMLMQHQMQLSAHPQAKRVERICADMVQYEYGPRVEAVVSNASVQWLEDLVLFARDLRPKLAPGTLSALSCFGPQNLGVLAECFRQATGHPWPSLIRLYDADVLAQAFEAAGWTIEQHTQFRHEQHAQDLKTLLHHFRQTGTATQSIAFGPAAWRRWNTLCQEHMNDGQGGLICSWDCQIWVLRA